MEANFLPALARIKVYEGGKVDNPKDPGGRTNVGITQSTYNAWSRKQGKPHSDVFDITDAEIETIYKDNYWTPCGGDELPSGLDLVVFDGAVNSGVGQSVSWLQACLNVTVDGGFGPKTEGAVKDATNDEDLINNYCEHRLGTLERLTTWPTFGKGWDARITNVRKIADAWSEAGQGANVGPAPIDVSDKGGHQKASMSDIKVNKVSQIATHITTVGTVAGASIAQVSQQLSPLTDIVSSIKWVLSGLSIASAGASIAVLLAKNANDAASNGTRTRTVNAAADTDFQPVPVVDTVPAPVTSPAAN